MPIHDWSRVPAGIFHHLLGTWLFELAAELNEEVLPPGYYALGEQVITGAVPDVLTLERRALTPSESPPATPDAVSAEPTATVTAVARDPTYPPRPRVLVVRHVSGDAVVAIVEIVSPGNKKELTELGAFVEKTVVTLSRRIHVTLVDLHPPGAFDPEGIHNVIWKELGQPPTAFDADHPLAVVSYAAGEPIKAYIEPLAVGDALPQAPLFLAPRQHVLLPLERSYRRAFARLPRHLQRVLE